MDKQLIFLQEKEWNPNQRYSHSFPYTLPAKSLMTNFFELCGQQAHITQPVKMSKNYWKLTFESDKREDANNADSEVIDYCKVQVEVLKKSVEGEED